MSYILVTGDRNYEDIEKIRKVFSEKVLENYPPEKYTLIHGGCRGADKLTLQVATEFNYPSQCFPALWREYGSYAGPKRNLEMVKMYPELILVFHEDLENSKGTKNCLSSVYKNLDDFPIKPEIVINGESE